MAETLHQGANSYASWELTTFREERDDRTQIVYVASIGGPEQSPSPFSLRNKTDRLSEAIGFIYGAVSALGLVAGADPNEFDLSELALVRYL